jgi:hypothetical protein
LSENLESAVNDKSRHITIRGREAIVPLKFDEDGNPAAVDKLIFKRLSLNDLRFLKVWREQDWDIAKAVAITGVDAEKAERLIKKLACFREEDAKVKALCAIPTPSWIAAKHVENVYSGGVVTDSEHKSLSELAKIEGAYKQQSVGTQINVFNLPKLTPEVEAKFKQLAEESLDTEAA